MNNYKVTIDNLMGPGSLDEIVKQIIEKPGSVSEHEVMIPPVATLRHSTETSGEPFSFIKLVLISASSIRRWIEGLQNIVTVGESMTPTIISGDVQICRPGEA